MFKEKEIAELKKHLDADGKLIISDDLSDKQKERFQFINSLNIDLVAVLSREPKAIDDSDDEDNEESDFDDISNSNSNVEVLDNVSSSIQEDDAASVDDLNAFF